MTYIDFLGILESTTGVYDIGPWSDLNLDLIDTFMGYYTVIASTPTSLTYSVAYGNEPATIPAICLYGKFLLYYSRYNKTS